jgi:D-alanine-D-alanine ligase
MTYTIAILTGGDSAERVISLKSAAVVREYLPKDLFRCFEIDIQGAAWTERHSGEPVDKNDFSLTIDGEHIRFDAAFAALHGRPLENGQLQGYLDIMGIPYTCCNGMVSALTMDKFRTKLFLQGTGIPVAQSVLVRLGDSLLTPEIQALGMPLFVKPNTLGSSFGITKVKHPEQLQEAVALAAQYDPEVLLEAFIPGREFSNGVFVHQGKHIALPVTEIIPQSEYFDYAAKYEGKSQEVTPANLPETLVDSCQQQSLLLYKALGCKGVVRFDYILSSINEAFYFLEANTIPGISPASIVPQQATAAGWALGDFFAAQLHEIL